LTSNPESVVVGSVRDQSLVTTKLASVILLIGTELAGSLDESVMVQLMSSYGA